MTKENTENCFFILHVLFLPNIYGTKGMINAVLLFSFLFIYFLFILRFIPTFLYLCDSLKS